MKQQRKSIVDPKALGEELRCRRNLLGKTLAELSAMTSVDVGQLSRLENGRMKKDGGNLQKLMLALQELEAVNLPLRAPDVVERFAAIIKRSDRHAEVATAFVDALEQLM